MLECITSIMDTNCVLIILTVSLCLMNCSEGARLCSPRCHKYYYDPYQDGAMMSEGEDMCSLSMMTLRTILRGLIAVITKVFPECCYCDCHREQKKEEPIKVFRQIVSCPSMSTPYYPSCCTPPTQIPPPPTFMHTQI